MWRRGRLLRARLRRRRAEGRCARPGGEHRVLLAPEGSDLDHRASVQGAPNSSDNDRWGITVNVRDLLLDQSDDVFGRTSRRLAGLTDEELVWEPAPHCWSVRERV